VFYSSQVVLAWALVVATAATAVIGWREVGTLVVRVRQALQVVFQALVLWARRQAMVLIVPCPVARQRGTDGTSSHPTTRPEYKQSGPLREPVRVSIFLRWHHFHHSDRTARCCSVLGWPECRCGIAAPCMGIELDFGVVGLVALDVNVRGLTKCPWSPRRDMHRRCIHGQCP
jgi:hypothetical protein